MALDYGYTIRIQSNGTSDPSVVPTNQWQRKLDGQNGFKNLDGETGSTYTVTAADKGSLLRLKQTFGGKKAFSNTLQVTDKDDTIGLPPKLPTYGPGQALYHVTNIRSGEVKMYFWNGQCFDMNGNLAGNGTQSSGEWLFITAKDVTMHWQNSTGDWDFGPLTDTSKLTNLYGCFWNCNNFKGDVSSFDTSNVTNMENVCYEANYFAGNVDTWDVSNVVTLKGAFANAQNFNVDISSWDTGKVEDMNMMFSYCKQFNQDIGNWDTKNVKNMTSMLSMANKFNQDLSGWCVTNVKSKPQLFDWKAGFENKAALQPQWGTCP